jgi:RNA polymerase sigma-70 factor (ECF subfamily)
LEDKLLIWKLNHGSEDALCQIYEKYRDNMVRIAAGLLNDTSIAEDIVQDVFIRFVHSAGKYKIRKSLKGYLTSCVVNIIRNMNRAKHEQESVSLDKAKSVATISDSQTPDQCVVCEEEFQHLYAAMAQLPYVQKEAVILHIQGRLKFREIAKLQGTSIKTTLSRYSYGLNKLRSILNGEIEK